MMAQSAYISSEVSTTTPSTASIDTPSLVAKGKICSVIATNPRPATWRTAHRQDPQGAVMNQAAALARQVADETGFSGAVRISPRDTALQEFAMGLAERASLRPNQVALGSERPARPRAWRLWR